MTRWAKITHRFEGLHRYSDAPLNVSYLQHVHRHLFHVTLWIEQFHNERDVEYLTVLQQLKSFLRLETLNVDSSCETIAENILAWARKLYPAVDGHFGRALRCEVLEDGENGALLEMARDA